MAHLSILPSLCQSSNPTESPSAETMECPFETVSSSQTTTELGMQTMPPPPSPFELKHTLDTEIACGLKQRTILQHWLGTPDSKTPAHKITLLDSLRDAMIVGLDIEWFEHDSTFVTELGISILDPRHISPPTTPETPSPWAILSALENYHVRIKPHAHLVNGELCKGYPEHFQFGTTTFVSVEEARDMLHDAFYRPDQDGHPRHVIFLGHAVDNDYQMIKSRFGIDIEALGVVVATLDTQVMAMECGIAAPGWKMGLSPLLENFGICEQFLHNAGNDIVGTFAAAMLMQYKSATTAANDIAYVNMKIQAQNAWNNVLSDLKRPLYGQVHFCTKCGSNKHLRAQCKAKKLRCSYCGKTARGSHSGKFCRKVVKAAALAEESLPETKVETKVSVSQGKDDKFWRIIWALAGTINPCPCEHCISSKDPRRCRGNFAWGHGTEECVWEEGKVDVITIT